MAQNARRLFFQFWLANVLGATASWHFSSIFRHADFKKGSEPSYFSNFDLEMCFAPQRHAIFRHLDFQKWFKTLSFLQFWLRNVLRATAACHFLTSGFPTVLREWRSLRIFTWNVLRATAACHFSCLLWPATSAPAALASLLLHTNHRKNKAFRDFPNIAHMLIFFLLTFAQL